MFGLLSKQFHRQTDATFEIGSLPTDPQTWPEEWKEIHHKTYPRLSKISLSQNLLNLGELKNSLNRRYSKREFDTTANITFDELSTILHYSAGIKPVSGKNKHIRRYYPSGGARYPLEVYLAVQRVEKINPGIYHFNVKDNVLEKLSDSKGDMDSLKEGLYYPWSRDAAVYYFITAVWDRNFMKYKDRGYRIVLMEAGHMAQNIALVSSNLGIGCCNSVGFHNQRINQILDIENEDEDSLYMAVLGK